jgi:hypothetical protein
MYRRRAKMVGRPDCDVLTEPSVAMKAFFISFERLLTLLAPIIAASEVVSLDYPNDH